MRIWTVNLYIKVTSKAFAPAFVLISFPAFRMSSDSGGLEAAMLEVVKQFVINLLPFFNSDGLKLENNIFYSNLISFSILRTKKKVMAAIICFLLPRLWLQKTTSRWVKNSLINLYYICWIYLQLFTTVFVLFIGFGILKCIFLCKIHKYGNNSWMRNRIKSFICWWYPSRQLNSQKNKRKR